MTTLGTEYRGDTVVYDGVATVGGSAVNLTGCTLRMTAKNRRQDTDAQAVFVLSSPSDGIAIVSAAAGTFTVTLVPADTLAMPAARNLEFDLQITDATGQVFTADSGILPIALDASITTP